MAVALQGTPSVYESASATSAVIPYPSGITAGELLLATVADSGSTAPNTNPGGWTLALAQAGPSSSPSMAVWYKIATGGEGGSVTFTTNATAGRVTGIMTRWSGVDNTTPMDATPVGSNSAIATTFTMAGITTVTANAMLVHTISLNASSAADIVTLSGTTKASGSTGTGRRQSIFYETQTSAGASGTRTWSNTPATSLQWAGVIIALRPAAGGGSSFTASGSLSGSGTLSATATMSGSSAFSRSAALGTLGILSATPFQNSIVVTERPPEQLFRLDLYNKNRVWQYPVGSFISLEGTKRFDNISDFSFTVKATHNRMDFMRAPGTRCRLQLRGQTLIEGPIRGYEGTGPGVSGSFRFDVEDNFRILRNFLIFQRPGESMANQSLAYRYEATGPVETVFKNIISANLGTRSVEPIIIAPNQGRGGTVTAQARMAKVFNEMFPLLESMGYGVSVKASPSGLTVDVYPITTYPNTLTENSRIIRKWKVKTAAPDVTAVVVGGENSGTNRTFLMYEDVTRQNLWGDRIEVFQDARDANDLNTYAQRGAETLYDGRELVSLECRLAETKNFKFGGVDGLNVGQRVTAKVADGSIVITDLLREIDFSWDVDSGLDITGTIGKKLDPEGQIVEALSTMSGSFNKLKASQ